MGSVANRGVTLDMILFDICCQGEYIYFLYKRATRILVMTGAHASMGRLSRKDDCHISNDCIYILGKG